MSFFLDIHLRTSCSEYVGRRMIKKYVMCTHKGKGRHAQNASFPSEHWNAPPNEGNLEKKKNNVDISEIRDFRRFLIAWIISHLIQRNCLRIWLIEPLVWNARENCWESYFSGFLAFDGKHMISTRILLCTNEFIRFSIRIESCQERTRVRLKE